MSNNYKRALEILSDSNIDYRSLIYKIASTHPSAIVHVVDVPAKKKEFDARTRLENDCRALMDQGAKIEAIKFWRAATGVGLKEAKDAVEAL
jgi:ribosomal protein L7/L12